jgi:protease IV
MRLRWVGVIVVAGVLLISATCVGAIIAIGVTQISVPTEDHIAVVPVHGQIVTRDPGGLFSPTMASAERIVEQLERAREDPSVKAVLLDIESPGGGIVASDHIHSEILRVKEEGIPVVAYFGDTAASGGYYVAAPADHIIANSATITGSIGAIAIIPNLEELYEKLGIEMQTVTAGELKDMLQPSRPMTDEERAVIQGFLDETHEDFINVVAEGRDMDLDEVRVLADGRIYTGRQAVENGLVDDLGDLKYAISFTGELAGLGSDPEVRDYGPDPGFWDIFFGITNDALSLPSPFDVDLDPRNMYLEIKYQAR